MSQEVKFQTDNDNGHIKAHIQNLILSYPLLGNPPEEFTNNLAFHLSEYRPDLVPSGTWSGPWCTIIWEVLRRKGYHIPDNFQNHYPYDNVYNLFVNQLVNLNGFSKYAWHILTSSNPHDGLPNEFDGLPNEFNDNVYKRAREIDTDLKNKEREEKEREEKEREEKEREEKDNQDLINRLQEMDIAETKKLYHEQQQIMQGEDIDIDEQRRAYEELQRQRPHSKYLKYAESSNLNTLQQKYLKYKNKYLTLKKRLHL
jgi:hypothetical protein